MQCKRYTFASKTKQIKLMSSSVITHDGVIDSISNHLVRVRIINMSACSGCHAKGACNAADQEEKIIDVYTDGTKHKLGEKVTIASKLSTGFKALLYGYLLPFILVLITLIVLTVMNLNEIKAGLFSLATLVPYYFILFIFRKHIKKNFTFEILT